jgi:hypothetical protein
MTNWVDVSGTTVGDENGEGASAIVDSWLQRGFVRGGDGDAGHCPPRQICYMLAAICLSREAASSADQLFPVVASLPPLKPVVHRVVEQKRYLSDDEEKNPTRQLDAQFSNR